MSIANANELKDLTKMTPAQIDELDFGVVKVDDQGVIQVYNTYESELGKVSPMVAIGKNFFTEIAPCTNNRLFFGRFQDGVKKGQLNLSMPYTFTYKMRPTNVTIQMYRDEATKTNWVLVERR
jgi:photoactive yellow protein